jgi:capsular polysaccharide biosynthesis protein
MRFLETLFRHRLLAIAPVILGLLVAAGYEVAQPHSYTSTGDLWVDATTPGQSNAGTNTYVDPSTNQQLVIQELLTSRSFDISVGQRGGLAGYLGAHPGGEATGLAAIPGLKDLMGSSQAPVDDQIVTLLATEVTVATAGPQIDAITATGPTSAVAAGTASAVMAEYASQVAQEQTASDQLAVTYYSQQVSQTLVAEQTAEQNLESFRAANPGVPADGTGNATATALIQAAADATTAYESLLQQYDTAELTLEDASNNVGFRVIDAPQAGTPISTSKKLLGAGLAGLLVGIVVSLLIMSALTAADKTAYRAEDIKRTLGLEVAGSIGRVAGGTSGASPQGTQA